MNNILRFLSDKLNPKKTPLADASSDARISRKEIDETGSNGLGWHIIHDAGLAGPLIRHNGTTGGFHYCIAYIPASQAGVVILAHTSSDAIDRAGIAILLAVLTLPLT